MEGDNFEPEVLKIINNLLKPLEAVFLSQDLKKNKSSLNMKPVEALVEQLVHDRTSRERMQLITSQVSQYVKSRYGCSFMDNTLDIERTAKPEIQIPEELKLKVVWDLDDCLIKSIPVTDEPEALKPSIEERQGGAEGFVMIHVDDDLVRYRTVIRRWGRLILTILSPFSRQYVFTSATRGYMENVVSLIEAGYINVDSDVDSKPKSSYPFFEANRCSRTDFSDPRYLRTHGKNVNVATKDRNCGIENITIGERVVLIDDKVTYHIAQPLNGIHVKPFDENDVELLQKLPLILNVLTAFENEPKSKISLQSLVAEAHTNEFWKEVMKRIVLNLAYDKVNGFGTEGDLDTPTESSKDIWSFLQKEINNWARSKSVLFEKGKRDIPKWRRKLAKRWKHVLQQRKVKLITTFEKERGKELEKRIEKKRSE
mmetsp:Transcript_2232/g.2565  ORF Transcript_2232/g.2565 Transcript_2232/m.2565 type:complete len:427 (+) Transcript_2232:246-1526(+)